MADFKGFAGGVSGAHRSPKRETNCFDNGVVALSCGRVAEAYLYFRACDQTQCAVLFNTAVCFSMSGSHEKALSYLDRALRLLPALSSHTETAPEELETYEALHDGYQAAMTADAPDRYPERCRVSILRLKADLLYATGNTQELKKLLPALSGRTYQNIERIKSAMHK